MSLTYPTRTSSKIILFLANIPLLCVALVLVMVAQNWFVQTFQRADCVRYAELEGLDPAALTFEGVVIATNQFQGHLCQFTTPAGLPVTVTYRPEDVPTGRDTAQVLAMVCPVLLMMMVGTILWEGLRSYLINLEKPEKI